MTALQERFNVLANAKPADVDRFIASQMARATQNMNIENRPLPFLSSAPTKLWLSREYTATPMRSVAHVGAHAYRFAYVNQMDRLLDLCDKGELFGFEISNRKGKLEAVVFVDRRGRNAKPFGQIDAANGTSLIEGYLSEKIAGSSVSIPGQEFQEPLAL